MATGGSAGIWDALEAQPEERLREAVKRCAGEKSLTIFTYGKTGVGKSSLVRDLLGPNAPRQPEVRSGSKPVTTETKKYEITIDNGLSVKVCDTRGMFELLSDEEDKETLRVVGNVCLNDVNGVLLICIPVHERIDRSTQELLTVLHKEHHEKGIWRFVVIALTKADNYPENEWLRKHTQWVETPKSYLKPEFMKAMSDAKESLKNIFTSGQIGMSEEEFNKIPILPTSQLSNQSALSKMDEVDSQSWFDALLLECCKKERGTHLVTIHSDRLANLSPEKLVSAGFPSESGATIIPVIKYMMGSDVGYLALIMGWKVYWHLVYSGQLTNSPRFEQDKRLQ